MPWETTVCISQKWFYNTTDTLYKTVDELFQLYKKATAQDNILIIDLPPNRDGRLRGKDIQLVLALRKKIDQ
jgi:alpha-L-fucosidase